MSLRLALLRLVLRASVKPLLAMTEDPLKARRDFALQSRLFRAPPGLCHLTAPADLHWISAGPVHPDRVILYLHGGAYVMGSPWTHVGLMGRLSRLTGLQVVAPHYRLFPEATLPAPLEDALAAHGRLLALGYRPADIVLAGDSAGGGLALALLAVLCRRGLRPAGLVAFSPWTDLAGTGASLRDNARADPVLPAHRLADTVPRLLAGLDSRDPRVSPLYAEFPAPPPVMIQVGAQEILRDDSLRIADVLRADGGQVRLDVWQGVPHVWQILDGWIPEARAALIEVAGFVAGLFPPEGAPTSSSSSGGS